ncbi:saccharopine dehydrogenase (NAD+, L-lysine forming) [Streptomyces sp. yr375]|uniref:saccharopine dehydrogenase n=1 Tax=Streptomyces sp. yr375 TaxID=1761906 RepID=UPI0008CB9119|nr:saccharopine dehydrogenase [Streptomyces sp. yr375]SES04938.1 saccharopine dehydrogenase (NAD+, L-lysine forming) [Streptomyces sp. yr375]
MPDDVPRLWIRHESRTSERRAPLTPEDAATLVARGIPVTVEESPQRVFAIGDYRAAGCAIAPAGSWTAAPADVYVVGLKELPDEPAKLTHRHIFFGHAYKGQTGARLLLDRFAAGGGALLDLEYLTDEDGRRLAAFGYWAGYVGAALAVLHRRGRLTTPLAPLGRAELDAALRESRTDDGLRALVTGALGRCGSGARDALATAGIDPTCWDLAETRDLDRPALLDHDILVNAVLTGRPVPPFLTAGHLDAPGRRLSVVSDVTCDVTSDCNVLPFNDRTTTWERPVRRLRDGERPLDVITIDNLPSLLPAEAARSFSADLLPHLLDLGGPPWERCLRTFHTALESAHV